MKITFITNVANHHNLPFSLAMYNLLGDNYCLITTESLPDEYLKQGYQSMRKQYPFIHSMNDGKYSNKIIEELAFESDILLIGGNPSLLSYDCARRKFNKLTFRFFERINKKGRWTLLLPPRLLSVLKRYVVYGNRNVFILCASAYTAGDFALLNAYKGKTYKWGYFPESGKTDIDGLFVRKDNEIIKILWVGRFIWWKHPEKALHVARQLKENGYRFELGMIGIGEKENTIKRLIDKHNLSDCVKMLGAMPPEKVREHMERVNIYLFTSNYHEGWGAVLNEAMASGCAVVASHAAGSTPYLVKHNQNGLVYRSRDIKDLYVQVKKLIDNKDLRERLGKAAYATLAEEWNAETAAESFIHLCERKLQDYLYAGEMGDGPCSIAEPIPQGRVYSMLMKGKNI